MNHIAILFLRAVAPALGVLLGLLGLATLEANLLGWFLFVAGVLYAAGAVIVGYVLKRNFWEANATGIVGHATGADHSFWLLTCGLAAVLYLSPLEFLYSKEAGIPIVALEIAGICLVALGAGLFLWARRSVAPDGNKRSAMEERRVPYSGPYTCIRHPGYAGTLLAAGGLALGYASWYGSVALLLILLPTILWRIHLDEKRLALQLGPTYREYASRTRRLIPGIW